MLNNHIAIFGGSFDPPHCGHQYVCHWLKYSLNIQEVIVAPVYQHTFGKILAPFENRFEMCDLMCKGNSYSFASRAEQGRPIPNTSYNLLKHFKDTYCNSAPMVLVIGADCLKDITSWDRWQELPSLAKILVIDRFGCENVDAPLDVLRYPLSVSCASSSLVRDKLAKGESVEGLVSYKIGKYIYKNKLYGVK
ncbi:MAG: nicotinate (nicotinamide) nucleotide adenylyltransferase [Patescibacteria group bacterium]